MASILDLVKHYQHAIEKYPYDEQKVLKCIDKLYNLDVTVQHLQETGVGRTVNALRKEPGDMGQAARALVYKWKVMVAAEESDQAGDQNNDAKDYNGHEQERDSDNNPSESKSQNHKSERCDKISKTEETHKHSNGDHSGSKRKYHSSEDDEPNTKKSKYSSAKDNGLIKPEIKVKVEQSDSEIDSEDDSSQSESDSEGSRTSEEDKKPDVKVKIEKVEKTGKRESSSHKHSYSNHDRQKHEYVSENAKEHHKHNTEARSSSEKTNKDKSNSSRSHKSSKETEKNIVMKEKEHKSNKEKKRGEDSSDRHKSSKEQKYTSSHNSEKHKTESSETGKRRSDSSTEKHNSTISSDKHRSNSSSAEKHRSNSSSAEKHRSSSSTEKHKSSSEKSKNPSEKSSNISEKHSSSKSHKDKHKSSSEKEISSKSKETNVSSSSKEKHSSSSKEKLKDKHSSSKEKPHSHKSDKKNSSSKDSSMKNSDSEKKSKSDRDESSNKKSKHKSSSEKSSSNKSKGDIPKKKSRSNGQDSDDDGIDCGSGASFAEALGMISPAKPKKKSLTKDSTQSPNSFSEDLSPATLLAPSAKLAPLPALEISALPEISPNYRPRPPPKFLPHFTDEDAMSAVISSKNQRTKVYSGNKVMGKIPTLYEMCVNILQEHIEALEYTGGVPYEILKPVVDKATPQQLFMLEHYNPYLIEDTDHLWQKFCEKSFRNKKRQELETWREMFMRCQEEQEIRLKSLTANIRIAQEAKKAPIKQTKMAYVDSVVKPPRNILKKQAQHGTAFAATASPAARVAALSAAPNVLKGGRAAPAPVITPSSSALKPKKAPLMQKALQFMRGRKR